MTLLHAMACWAVVGGLGLPTRADPKKAESYVEIDFSPLPGPGEGKYSLTVTVLTADEALKYEIELKRSRRQGAAADCSLFADSMEVNRFKAEVVGKTKLRVYGRLYNGKLIPATQGKVTSPDLKPQELPKVKNPPKA